MSISGISSSASVYRSQFQQTKKDFTALQTDLSSGNLTAAQQAYATLTQDIQNITQAQSGQLVTGNSQISNDLAAVGTALNAGDLTGAQSAFATLTQDIQSAAQSTQQVQNGQQAYKGHGHHHHHHHGGTSQTAATTLSNDLAAVGTALNAGDLTGAQSAYTTLMQDLGSGSSQNVTAASGTAAGSQAVGSTVNTVV